MIPWNQIAICNGKTAAEKHNLCFLVNDKETIINGVYRPKLFILLCSSTLFLYKLFCLSHHRLGTPCTLHA